MNRRAGSRAALLLGATAVGSGMLLLGAPLGCQRSAPGRASPSPSASTDASPPPPAEAFEPSPLAPGERRPLVIFLHGLGGSGAQLFHFAQLAELGRAHRLFVVAPDGTRDHAGRRFWNAGAACCDFDRLAVGDVARLEALIDWWRAHRAVDASRVYVAGFSNGGFMAHRLACAAANRIAAVASVGGAAPDPRIACAGGVADRRARGARRRRRRGPLRRGAGVRRAGAGFVPVGAGRDPRLGRSPRLSRPRGRRAGDGPSPAARRRLPRRRRRRALDCPGRRPRAAIAGAGRGDRGFLQRWSKPQR